MRHEIRGLAHGPQIGQAANLGLTGMNVVRPGGAGEAGLPVRTPLRVVFQLPQTGHMMELMAEVVFDRPKGDDQRYRLTGLRFHGVPPEAEAQLRSLLPTT